MRDFIDAILSFIGATSLTDEEFATITISIDQYTKDLYLEILSVLDSRELVSNTRDRLTYYFKARGIDVVESSPARSNIFAGSGL